MIIWLASYPRSGNHFFRHALHALHGVSSHTIYREKPHQDLYGDTEVDLNSYQIEEMDRLPEPVFVKTHEMPGDDRYPAIYLIRDGRDALVSLAHYTLKEQAKGSNADSNANFKKILGNLILYNSAFGGWASHVTAWSARPQTALVRFDNLVAGAERAVSGALRELNLELPRKAKGTVKTFEQLHKESPDNFRRGKTGIWKEEMPGDLHALFCFLNGDVLKRFGYRDGIDEVPVPEHQEIRGLVVRLQHALDEERKRNTSLRSDETRRAFFAVIEQHRKDLYSLRRRFVGLKNELRKARETVKAPEPPKGKAPSKWKDRLAYPVQRVKGIFAPRIGVLRQHGPKPMRSPPAFSGTAPAAWPKISVVTPSLNQKVFLLQAMRSVLDSGYPNLEYLVVDGGSADGSKEVIETEGKRLAYWTSRRDGGQAEAVQHGFDRAGGEIMGWLNSDDLLLPGALQRIGAYFAAHPDVDVVYGHRILIDEDSKEIGRWVMPPHDPEILRWVDYIPQETLYWRRSLWEKTGARMDVKLHFALDWELLHRFAEAKARFARLPQFLAAFRIHKAQKTVQERNREHPAAVECDTLRDRIQGRSVSRKEVAQHARRFQKRGRTYHWLYKLGIMI